MRRFVLAMMIICMLLLAMSSAAQETDAPLLIAYRDAAGVHVYDEAADSTTLILAADTVPDDARVRAKVAPSGDTVAVAVEQVYSGLQLPLDQEGMLFADLGLTNRLLIFSADGREILNMETLHPETYVWFFNEFDDLGYFYTTLLDIDFGGPLLEWSPDGSRLLFEVGTAGSSDMEAFDPNGSGRLMAFNAADETLSEIQSTNGRAFLPVWSPDSRYAVFRSIRSFGTGAGYSSNGTYVLGPDNTLTAIDLQSILTGDYFGLDTEPVGWLSETEYAFSMFNLNAGAAGLFIYDAEADALTTVIPATQYNLLDRGMSMDVVNRRFTAIPYNREFDLPLDTPGIYLLDEGGANPLLVHVLPESPRFASVVFTRDNESLVWRTFDSGTSTFYRLDIDAGEVIPLVVMGETPEIETRFALLYDNGIIGVTVEGTTVLFDPATEQALPVGDVYARASELEWLNPSTYVEAIQDEAMTTVVSGTLTSPARIVFETDGDILDIAVRVND